MQYVTGDTAGTAASSRPSIQLPARSAIRDVGKALGLTRM